MRAAWLALLLLLARAPARAASLGPVRSAYLEHCGGCHGIDGHAYAPRVPELAGQAGYFLCTPQARAYIAQLPNVAFARLSPAMLAALMNYAVFTLGAGSAPAHATPYSAREIVALRAHPIDDPALLQRRAEIIAGVLRVCPRAIGLLSYGVGK